MPKNVFFYPSSVGAIKSTLQEVTLNIFPLHKSSSSNTTLTNLVGEFARTAESEDWIDLFDVLTGSLLVLLNRIHVIHKVISEAISSANATVDREGQSSSAAMVAIPEAQLETLLVRDPRFQFRNVVTSICRLIVFIASIGLFTYLFIFAVH